MGESVRRRLENMLKKLRRQRSVKIIRMANREKLRYYVKYVISEKKQAKRTFKGMGACFRCYYQK